MVPAACPVALSAIRNEITPARSAGSVSRTTRVRLSTSANPLNTPSSVNPNAASTMSGAAPTIMAQPPIPARASG